MPAGRLLTREQTKLIDEIATAERLADRLAANGRRTDARVWHGVAAQQRAALRASLGSRGGSDR